LRIAEHAVDRAVAAVQKLGTAPTAHPWRGATGDLLTPFDGHRLREAVDAAYNNVRAISAFLDQIGEILGPSLADRLEDIPRIAVGLRHLAQMPNEGRAALLHPAWRSNRERIRSLHDRGRHWSDRSAELGQQVSDVVWGMQLEPLRRPSRFMETPSFARSEAATAARSLN
jgi:hypothetical protein